MSSGDERSPISLDSDFEASQDKHPVDAVIRRAICKQQSPANMPNATVTAGKRKREPTPADADVISLHSTSSEEDTYESDREDAEHSNSPPPPSRPAKVTSVAPIGVTVVEEGAQTRNAEVQRLLRGARQVSYLQHAVFVPSTEASFLEHFSLAERQWTLAWPAPGSLNEQPCSRTDRHLWPTS